jgi:hypothetical protein
MIDLILVSASLLPAVTRSGILPCHSVFQGDHRPCYIDLDVSLAFDGKTPSISPPCQCTLQLHDPCIVVNYISALHQQFKCHKILQKIEFLYAVEPTLWTPQHQIEYECLDALITESMLCAESRSAKKYMNTYAWPPTLVCSVSAERFWRLVIKRSQGHHVAADILHRTKVSTGIMVDISQLTLPDAVQCLQSACQTRKDLQQNHLQLRRNYLVSLAQALVLKRGPISRR